MIPERDKWKQFGFWMIGILAFAAFIGFVIVEPGPTDRMRAESAPHVSRTVKPVARGGHGKQVVAQPDAVAGDNTNVVTEPGAGSDNTGQAPTRTIQNARSAPKTGTMEAHELFSLMENNPEAIAMITFNNGSDRVIVKRADNGIRYYVTLPEGGGKEAAISLARQKNIAWTAQTDSTSAIRGFLFSFGPIILIGAIFLFIWNRNRKQAGAGGGNPGMNNFAKSKAQDHDEEGAAVRRVTFDDVAGCDEAIVELKRIARGLKRRKLYSFFGAKLPKGVILVGPPGTGKTLLARAVAGETDGTFSSTSGSDFVEMFVGVGASRVRDTFAKGREKVKKTGKPHIIFIDEIDAVGGKRGGGTGESSNSEREQTLNAILVEMDGMKNNEGLILIAATNRVDMLDDALMRPGRFDAQVSVELPNKEGRAAIFGIHTRNKPLAEGINNVLLADRSYGYSGAEIEGACNRAALLAAERCGAELPEDATEAQIDAFLKEAGGVITLADFDEGVDFVRFGSANTSKQKTMASKEKKNTAIHEAAHACASDIMPGADPVVKITIMSRSKALGYVQNMPSDDRYSLTVVQIVARMVTAMAGRAGQEQILGQIDTGASNDFEQASQMAHSVVTRWGMSRLGHFAVGRGGAAMRGMGSGPVSNYGPKLADRIDDEWMRINEECFKIAMLIVEKDRERIEALAEILMEKETVLGDEWVEFTRQYPSKVDKEALAFDPAAKSEEG
ncbi:MAG: ATP-dependent zinc metalloprotease FtsH [Candidatus Obscuribacterales bacterium]|nr:ATP-dependent zinc metalloprotease FtsH [Candidatus Obscuribacterales bacterium]